ncbi:hypothetical protein FRC02_004282, partial [Tulasnella sp. 418]
MPTSQVSRPISTAEYGGVNIIQSDPTQSEGTTVPETSTTVDRSGSGSLSTLEVDPMLASPASISSESSTRVLHGFAEIARIWLLFGITTGLTSNATNPHEDHVIVRILQDDLRLTQMLFPLSITLLGFSLCVNKNVAGNISKWTSLLAF